jgi:hypothetical protein
VCPVPCSPDHASRKLFLPFSILHCPVQTRRCLPNQQPPPVLIQRPVSIAELISPFQVLKLFKQTYYWPSCNSSHSCYPSRSEWRTSCATAGSQAGKPAIRIADKE